MEKDWSVNTGQGDVFAVSCLSSPRPEPSAKRARNEVAEPSSASDSCVIRIVKMSGATEEFHPVGGELVEGLLRRVAFKFRIDTNKYAIKLISAKRQLEDDEPVQQFVDSMLNLHVSKRTTVLCSRAKDESQESVLCWRCSGAQRLHLFRSSRRRTGLVCKHKCGHNGTAAASIGGETQDDQRQVHRVGVAE